MPSLLLLGAHSDIGKACAQQFAAAGFDLLLTRRRVDPMDVEVAQQLMDEYGISVRYLNFNALDPQTHEELLQKLDGAPDVLLLALGYLGDAARARNSTQESQQILSTNFTGLVPVIDQLALTMQQRQSGSIIGISSVAGERGRASNYHYGAAKAGFTTYLSGLRQHLRSSGVHIATIIPGFVKTKMLGDLQTPALLTASPEQVAQATFKAYQNQRSLVYSLPWWRPIMWIIRHLPEAVFKRLSL
ncbi:MAG: SDR family oxidoreductase [Bacteroidota bacterium]